MRNIVIVGCLLAVTGVAASFFLTRDDPVEVVIAACQEAVRDELVSPGTARFLSPDSADYAEPIRDGETWMWISEVDSENGFGALLRSSFICTVEPGEEARVSVV